jgi:hypothetical protein
VNIYNITAAEKRRMKCGGSGGSDDGDSDDEDSSR